MGLRKGREDGRERGRGGEGGGDVMREDRTGWEGLGEGGRGWELSTEERNELKSKVREDEQRND